MTQSLEAPKKVFLKLPRAPGDTVALTAFIRDLKLSRPDTRIWVRSTGDELILAHNPYIEPFDVLDREAVEIMMDYRPGLEGCKLGMALTYLEEFHRDFLRKFRITIPLTDPRPDLHLTEEERQSKPLASNYWVVVAGHKWDMSVKGWYRDGFQKVINHTSEKLGITWVQVGATGDKRLPHKNFELSNIINLIGQTSFRDLMVLIYHSSGVLCGATMAMLIAAAFWRPCVVIAGGRENWEWLAFTKDNPAWGVLAEKIVVPHRILHTIGKLDCCKSHGCYTAQVVPPHNDTAFPDNFLCKQPVRDIDNQPIPKCMQMIGPELVIDCVESYYR